jgi:hypothetical protein
MVAPRQEQPSKQPRLLMHLGQVAGALALVIGLSGFGIATAESGSTSQHTTALAGASGSLETVVAQPSPSPMPSPAPSMAPPMAAGSSMDNDNEAEEEEEEGQEDGLLPGGQAEQRSQGLGDKAEARDEDHENSP